MLEDYQSSQGLRLKIEWVGWLLYASIDDLRDAFGLHDQDFIHNREKLVNSLDSLVCVLQLGGNMCALEHLGLVYNMYTYKQHGLKLEDV